MHAATTAAGTRPAGTAAPSAHGRLKAGIAAFALLHTALALTMAVAPHAFYRAIGPFGPYNAHYIRDTATFYAAFALAGAVSLARPSWRAPVLFALLVQYALHSVNHLVDIDHAHPAWTGYFDFATLAAATLLIAWLLREALRMQASGACETTQQRRNGP
jgi:uncharacterized membrane protein